MEPQASNAVAATRNKRRGRTRAHRKRRAQGQSFASGKRSNEELSSPSARQNNGASDASSFASPQFTVEKDPAAFLRPVGAGGSLDSDQTSNVLQSPITSGEGSTVRGGTKFLSTPVRPQQNPGPSKRSSSRLSPDFRSLPSSPSSSSAYSSIDEAPDSPHEEQLHHLPPPIDNTFPESFAGLQTLAVSQEVFDKAGESAYKEDTEQLVSRSTDIDEASSVQKTPNTCTSFDCRGRETGPGMASSKRSPSAGFSGLPTPTLLERPLSAAAAAVAAIRLWKTTKDFSILDEPVKAREDLTGLDTPADSEPLQESHASDNSEPEGTVGDQDHGVEETSVVNTLRETTALSGKSAEEGLAEKSESGVDALQVSLQDCKELRPQEEEESRGETSDRAVLQEEPASTQDRERGKKAVPSVKSPSVAQLPTGSIRSREAEEVSVLIENQWHMLVGSQGWGQ